MENLINMSGEKIWELSGDMSIKEAIRSYGSPYNAAKAAVALLVEEGVETGFTADDLSDWAAVERKVENFLISQ